MEVPRLVCVAGPREGSVFPLQADWTTIGRSPECAIAVPGDANLSRVHAEIQKSLDGYTVTDLKSTNGTLVNRAPVFGETALHHLDVLQVGMTSLRFEDVSFVAIPSKERPTPAKARRHPKFLYGLLAGLAIGSVGFVTYDLARGRGTGVKETEAILASRAGKPRLSLFQAAVKGDLDEVEAHIAAGTNLALRDANGFTALHLAAYEGRFEVVKLLVSAGADVNAEGANGKTPLQTARMAGEVEILRYLRAHGGK